MEKVYETANEWAKSSLVLFILTVPFVEPQIFKTDQFIAYDTYFDYAKLISALIIILIYLISKRGKISKIVLLSVILQGWIFLSTVVCHGSVSRFAGPAITMVVITMLGEMALETQFKSYIGMLCSLLTLMVFLNLLSICGMQLGLLDWDNPLLGIDNRWIYVLLPWVLLTFMFVITSGKSVVIAWCAYFVAVAHVLAVWSVGAVISLAVWPICWLIVKRYKSSRLDGNQVYITRIMYLAFLVVNVLLVCNLLLPLLSPVISSVLQKDITLAGRTYLWETVLNVLRDNPLFGMGVQSEQFDLGYFFAQSGNVVGCEVNHPHNNLLNIAYHGGLVALLIYIGIIYLCMKAIDLSWSSELSRCLFCCFVAFFTASLVDTLDYSLFHLLVPLACGVGTYERILLSPGDDAAARKDKGLTNINS